MPTMTTDDLRDSLYEAQEHLYEVIRLIETYVSQTNDRNAEAYLLDHLRIFAGRDHGFLSRDLNIDDLIERLDERDDEEDGQPESDGEPESDGLTSLHIRTAAGLDLYYAPGIDRYVSIPEDEE